MLDAPCGDLNWLQHVDLGPVNYLGYDIEPSIVERNQERFPDRAFRMVNLLTTPRIPNVDLILCRDFLFHIPTEHIIAVLQKFRDSGSTYLIATNHPGATNNRNCPLDGGEDGIPGYYCQPVDLEADPIKLAGRIEAIRESRDAPQELVLFKLEKTT
jgi:hypothetical protein